MVGILPTGGVVLNFYDDNNTRYIPATVHMQINDISSDICVFLLTLLFNNIPQVCHLLRHPSSLSSQDSGFSSQEVTSSDMANRDSGSLVSKHDWPC